MIYNVIGIMSGTSLDGLDIVLCNFEKNGKWTYTITASETIPYSAEWKKKLSDCDKLSGFSLLLTHNEYGKYIGESVNNFLEKRKLKADLIASHGHTIFHQPDKGITVQIGNGAVISTITGITTVSDFRTQDVANGGQGAPLVPAGDEILFSDYTACLNLGGFSNISFKRNNKRIAFDICPVNIVLNYLSAFSGKDMDEDGRMAFSGKIIDPLLSQLENIDFYYQAGPKSLGKEWVEKCVFPLINEKKYTINDLLRTFIEHIALRISAVLNELGKGEVLITGGGAFNKFLIDRLSEKSFLSIVLPDKQIINYKEALIFALLGVLRYRNEKNCFGSVTGAKSDISAGIIHLVK